jgi:hypothetical protein
MKTTSFDAYLAQQLKKRKVKRAFQEEPRVLGRQPTRRRRLVSLAKKRVTGESNGAKFERESFLIVVERDIHDPQGVGE